LNAAEPIDFLSWTSQTQIRKGWEELQCQLTQCAKSSANHSEAPRWIWLLLSFLLRILAAIVLGIVVFLLVRQVWRWFRVWSERTVRPRQMNWVEPVRSRLDWLAIAQEAQARQDYHRAFEALYRALLVQLHESGVLRQDAARTDGEYILGLDQLWSLGDKPLHLREDWVTLFRTHESLCFGRVELQQGHFDRCRAAYDSLAPYLDVNPGLGI
jgi:Domain of unknown function (DUF4129)